MVTLQTLNKVRQMRVTISDNSCKFQLRMLNTSRSKLFCVNWGRVLRQKTRNMSTEEQRVIMNFLVQLGDSGGDTVRKLHTLYGDGALKAMVVYK